MNDDGRVFICVFFTDVGLQVLWVHVGEVAVYIVRAVPTPPTAETTAAATAAASDDTAENHQPLKPALGHEEVVFDAAVSKLLGHIQAHGSVLVINLAFVLIAEDGVGVVDLLKLLCRLWVVWVFVRVMS